MLSSQALLQALGDRKGIQRFGNFGAPLDEAAIEVILVACINFFSPLKMNITALEFIFINF